MPVTVGPGVPLCLGVVDAAPYAQGCILVRWYEACADGVPIWRYEFHVKRVADGPLTPAEINAGTYFARSVKAFDITSCIPGSPAVGSPAINPGILMAALAFESPGSITPPVVPDDDNIHLFTSQQYYIAVRALALDPVTNIVYEDPNEEVTISYSSGYQGVVWQHILSWPCLELCANPTPVPVQLGSLPDLTIASIAGTLPIPPLDVQVRATDVVQDLSRVLVDALREAVKQMKE